MSVIKSEHKWQQVNFYYKFVKHNEFENTLYDTGSYYSEKQVFQFKNLVNKKVIKLQS